MAGEPLSVEPVTLRLGGVLLLVMLTSRLGGDSVCGTLRSDSLLLEGVTLLETLTSEIDMGEGVRLALLDVDATSRRDGDTDL